MNIVSNIFFPTRTIRPFVHVVSIEALCPVRCKPCMHEPRSPAVNASPAIVILLANTTLIHRRGEL